MSYDGEELFFDSFEEMENETGGNDDDSMVGVRGGNDIVDATELECPVCYNAFKDNDNIVLFGCNFSHYVCSDCASRFSLGSVCHLCRTPVTSVQVFKCQIFNKGGGTREDPIVINE